MWNWTKGQPTITINCLNLLKNYNDIPKVHGDISSAREWEVEQWEVAIQNLRECKTDCEVEERLDESYVSAKEKSWQHFIWIRDYLQLFLSATQKVKNPFPEMWPILLLKMVLMLFLSELCLCNWLVILFSCFAV